MEKREHSYTVRGNHQIVSNKMKLIAFYAAEDEKLYTVSKNSTRSCLWLRSSTPYAKFKVKLKKVEKTIRLLSYDLNQIPYDYAVDSMNRFKGLDLVNCLKKYGWRFITLYRRQ